MGFVKIAQHEFHNCLHYYRKERLNSIEMGYLPFTTLLWSSVFVTLMAKKYHKSITLNAEFRTGYDNR